MLGDSLDCMPFCCVGCGFGLSKHRPPEKLQGQSGSWLQWTMMQSVTVCMSIAVSWRGSKRGLVYIFTVSSTTFFMTRESVLETQAHDTFAVFFLRAFLRKEEKAPLNAHYPELALTV